ncbi:hypothetical protein TWF106_000825 [Orbilia oligospora]|uniref:F-box domain-containing protein n=1 Tax=Orbilia oligospora TaxID=2813651 RepID=A0A7C8QW34_ORBOL|nr:hypothetical protein TWF106_000825 [Orbilia oligospora]
MHKDILPLSPVDIQLEILSYLEDYRSLFRWTRVSKRWRDFVRSPSLEPLYRRLVTENWPKEYKQISRRRACPTNSQTPRFGDILFTLERNLANIKKGRLHEAGTLVIPHLGRVEFCYAEGYLAVFTTGKSGTSEQDTVYVYDLSIVLNPTAVINARKEYGTQRLTLRSDTKLEEMDLQIPRGILLWGDCGHLPRVVVDKKQPRHDEDWEFHYHADFQPGSKFATECEYNIQYLNEEALYWFLTPKTRSARTSNARVIPHLSPTSVSWQLQFKDEQIPIEGGKDLNVRKVKIVGSKPTFLVREKIVYKYRDTESSNTPYNEGRQDEDHSDEGNDGEDPNDEGNNSEESGGRNKGGEDNNGENHEGEGNDNEESDNRDNNGEGDDSENEDNSEERVRYVFYKKNVPEPASALGPRHCIYMASPLNA